MCKCIQGVMRCNAYALVWPFMPSYRTMIPISVYDVRVVYVNLWTWLTVCNIILMSFWWHNLCSNDHFIFPHIFLRVCVCAQVGILYSMATTTPTIPKMMNTFGIASLHLGNGFRLELVIRSRKVSAATSCRMPYRLMSSMHGHVNDIRANLKHLIIYVPYFGWFDCFLIFCKKLDIPWPGAGSIETWQYLLAGGHW